MSTITEIVEAVIGQWFEEKIRCGEIAHHTPAYNQAAAAVNDLKSRLAAALGGEISPDAAADAAADSSTDANGGRASRKSATTPVQPAADPATLQE